MICIPTIWNSGSTVSTVVRYSARVRVRERDEMAMAEEEHSADTSLLLPLSFFRPQLVPPAPNLRSSVVDCLSDLGGASWIAYGAGPLVVISPLTSPPFFRQVIELPELVNAVSWSPTIPSLGEIAIAAGSTIFFYAPVSSPAQTGSFSWKQRETIVENYTVEAIAWTGTGDALVAAGFDVVLWLRKKPSWEVGWRSRAQVPQNVVSATGFAQGPVATASLSNIDKSPPLPGDVRNNVLVYLTDGKAGLRKLELPHPCGVSMIQWRPASGRHLQNDHSNLRRDVLLTCSIDGTARLWSDCGGGRSKDSHNIRNRIFHVIATVEINSCLSGTLGTDISLMWAVESRGVVSREKAGCYSLSENDADLHQPGACDWLVSTGPALSVSFWAVHCLDDMSPVRYPRVNLWKKQKLTDQDLSKDSSILVEVRVSRKLRSGPPVMCSLVQLLPDCKIVYSKFYSPIPESGNAHHEVNSGATKERCLSCISSGVLNQDGHKGSIRQACIYPYSCKIDLSVSLDSDGVLLFWSLAALSTFSWNLHTTSIPVWNLIGRVELKSGVSSDNEFSCLTWAPSPEDQTHFLLLASGRQIDCFGVRILGEGEGFISQNIFTVPFDEANYGEGPPDDIFTISLGLGCDKSVNHSCFLVSCVWKQKFQILSWKVNLHCATRSGSMDGCSTDYLSNEGGHQVSFEGDAYYVTVTPCSPKAFSTSQDGYEITCFSYALPNPVVFPIKGSCGYSPWYHIITGCSDGSVKLWKLGILDSSLQSEKESPSWELVGSFLANSGCITTVSFSNCGTRIATLSNTSQTGTSCIGIWEPVCIPGGTSAVFLLEHTITLKSPVVQLSWFSIGNGQLLLGLSLEKELRVYSQRMPDLDLIWPEKSKETCFWNCIAVSPSYYEIKDFLWGPKATPVLVHDKHLSVYSQGLFKSDCQSDASSITCASNIQEICEKTSVNNLLDLAGRLGGPFPLYHPKSIMWCLYSGKWKRAQEILQDLLQSGNTGETLRKIPEIHLSKYFSDVASTDVSNNTGLQWGMNTSISFASSFQFSSNAFDYRGGMGNSNFTMPAQKSDMTVLRDVLNKCSEISGIEKTQILVISDILGEINDPSRSSPYKNLDEAGRMFWISVQFQRHYFAQKSGNSVNEQGWHVNSALIAWAFQSECKDDLLSSTLSSEPSWLEMRALGIGFWYNDVTQLRAKMEKLARMQYLKKKDPKECALLYIALNRIQVLAGLFKISKDEKDKVLFAFLCRNFQEEKNKAAALKNAYVLMGRHQLELAIAFFLLGGDVSSAVSICAKNYGDEQLALVICRLREGNAGLLERDLISNVLIPSAIEKGDRWLASLFEWKLGNYSQAVQKIFENFERGRPDKSRTQLPLASFFDPQVGRYCAILASKSSFKKSVGEVPALRLSKVFTALGTSAFNRYGLPLEALECLSLASSVDSRGKMTASSNEDFKVFQEFVNPSSDATLSWMSGTAASHIMSSFKLMMASKYLPKILCDYVPFLLCNHPFSGEIDSHLTISDAQIGELRCELRTALSVFEKKFIMQPGDLIDMVSLFLCNKEMLFVVYLLFGADSLSVDRLSTVHPLLLKTNKEICCFLSRYVVSCGFTNSILGMASYRGGPFIYDYMGKYYLTYLKRLLGLSRSLLKSCHLGTGGATDCPKIFSILDLLEYTVEFALSWLVEDVRGLVILFKPILEMVSQGQSDLTTTVDRLTEALQRKISDKSEEMSEHVHSEQNVASTPTLSNDEKWLFICTCLWIHLSTIIKNPIMELTDTEKQFAQLLINSVDFIRSLFIKQLAFYLTRQLLDGLDSNALMWLDQSCGEPANLKHNSNQQVDSQRLPNNGERGCLINLLWEMSVRPQDICTGLADEKVIYFQHNGKKLSAFWKDADRILETKGHHSGADKDIDSCFENPRELIKRTGELLEATCFNSTNEQQVATTSNKKGLLFFNWTNGQSCNEEADYIWSESEWPINGWAGHESSPVPTCISPGFDQSSKRDAHLGLGGAATGLGALAKPGREMTGGGAFGIPGYAGIGAASMVWGQHDEFDVLTDLPATVETVQSCALSHHPLRPLLLVGSSNTHVYLWEFGKERALATYGVLPAVNVPPPYPLASISAVRFDTYGHRFATAASDGTVCTWQLEVGGRSNVHPVDSSLCFDNHASDVSYISASGSVVATAGYSSNNVNVVVWDTLVPPATCQASVICHDGGAHSLAVFDNDIGSGSISPYIVTGGKSGDIGLHDFRFITTGKTKSQRHKSSAMYGPKLGTHHSGDNTSGMVWYMPKAHLGSITRIATIPNTSMFLTGSKDGDVKLWDAKRSVLVYQWPKLHERHTFFQSNSRVFGGVIRAAVTDIQVMSHGFLTCGGDGSVKLIQLKSC